jgi:hypothetical protein
MSAASFNPISLGQVIGTGPTQAPEELESVNLNHREPVAAHGELVGRQISLGNGEARQKSIDHAANAKTFFKGLGLALASPLLLAGGLVAGAVVLAAKAISTIPRLVNEHMLEPSAERKWQSIGDNAAMVKALIAPMDGSLADKTSILPGNPSVMSRLLTHAQQTGRPNLGEAEIRGLVAMGERIAEALAKTDGEGKSPLRVTVDGQAFDVPSNTYTARALGWYMMAAAASQDMARAERNPGDTTSDMPTNGSLVMKDPGNRLYNFLNGAPTAASRMSTHFGERSATTDKHEVMGFIKGSKLSQRGLEDYQSKMPGGGGTMLFDKLKADSSGTPELFVKFEHGGTPPYFQSEPHMGVGQKIARFFAALDRNIGHATSFIATRFDKSNPNEVRRQEHVYKGVLKESVHKPFAQLIDQAVARGVIDADSKAIGKSVHQFGLPYLEDALDRVISAAKLQSDATVLKTAQAVNEAVIRESRRLGLISRTLEIERRGAEVHISMDVAHNQGLRG